MAYCRSVEKKIPNNVGARTHPCFTPQVILKGWDTVQLKLIVLWVFSWKDDMMLRSVGGHPIFFRIFEQSVPTDKIKGFGKVSESYVQWFVLFPAFFL